MAASSSPRALPMKAIGPAVIIVAAVWWMSPVLIGAGWPMDHEILSLFERVEGFRRELAHGNWYPLWSPYFQHGYGSPYPLFYHRLFSFAAAALSLVPGLSVIVAVKLMTCLLLVVACLGMRDLLLASGASEEWSLLGALLFLVSPYLLTDWLVRGALAEFSALALLPWLYGGLCRFIQGDRQWIRLGVLLTLLFHAHSMICYFFLLSLAGFLVWSFRTGAWAGVRREWPRALGAAAIVFFGVIPHTLVAMRLLPYFNSEALGGIPGVPLRISENYQPFINYLADTRFHWGTQWRSLSVEVNRYAVGALVILHLLPGAMDRWRRVWRVPLYPFLICWSLICLALQLPVLGPLFDLLPFAHYLQFAWRLLAFMTIGLIFAVITVAQTVWTEGAWRRWIAGGSIAAAIALTAALVWHGREPDLWAAPEVINADLAQLDGSVSFGEYLLKGMDPTKSLPDRPLVTDSDCATPLHVTDAFQDGVFLASATESAPCKVSIRQLQSPLLEVTLTGAQLLSKSPSEEIEIGLAPGRSTVEIRPYSFPEMIVWALR